jgi:serine/threonine protein kinase
MEGKVLGNYRVIKKIGEGGMGEVYLSRDMTLERDVAIKVISPELARNPNLMARFRVEAIAQARLNFPNIVTIHSFEQLGDTYYIVMEYVDGKTLKNIIKESPKMPVQRVLKIFSGLLEGMAYAHKKGVLHRDIKPANIFVAADETVKIADFGIAKVSGIDGLTRVGSTVGTPLYSSPEQIRGEKVGPEADIYSIGVTLYEALTGVQPFKTGSGSDFEIQKAHLEVIPGKPSTINSTVSPALDAVIMKSISKSPAQRYRSAEAFKKAIDQFSAEEKPSAAPVFDLSPLKNIRLKIPSVKIEKIKGIEIPKKLKDAGKNAAHLFKTPAGNTPPVDSRRKILLLILIPLLILLLIAIAYSDEGKHIPGNIKAPATKIKQINGHPGNVSCGVQYYKQGGINEN